jgi:hypothetical protein
MENGKVTIQNRHRNLNRKQSVRTLPRPVLTIKVDDDTIDVYMLNPGEHFPDFAGSRQDLVVQTTASLITRRRGLSVDDEEKEINDKQFWAWMARMLNGDGPEQALVDTDHTAERAA